MYSIADIIKEPELLQFKCKGLGKIMSLNEGGPSSPLEQSQSKKDRQPVEILVSDLIFNNK